MRVTVKRSTPTFHKGSVFVTPQAGTEAVPRGDQVYVASTFHRLVAVDQIIAATK
ncbi:MAG: hypothetical protein WAM97_22495 [Acidimicrobiales bacterium]